VHTIPTVTRVGSREFVLNVWTEGVTTGMFVNSTGNISRPPLQWPFGPTATAVNYPYIVATNNEQGMATVHSMLDQQTKQVLFYPDGIILNDTSERIFIASGNTISLIANLSFDTQIDELLDSGRVAEALTLAQVTFGNPDGSLDAADLNIRQQSMQRIQRRGGMCYLREAQFAEGMDLLAATDTDPREIVSLFPNLLPASSSYSAVVPTQELNNIEDIAKTESQKVAAKKALVNFLNVIRSDHVTTEWNQDIDTVLARLYAELDGAMLLELVTSPNCCSRTEIADALAANNRHHALALIHWQNKAMRQALEIWRGLTTKKLSDLAYPGLEFAIKTLTKTQDADLVYTHAEWMLNADQSAVRIFTQRDPAEAAGLLKPADVMAFLRPYGKASLEYLEYLVFEVQDENEPYHTRLALLYLERVKVAVLEQETQIQAGGEADDMLVITSRSKLKIMLQSSAHYRVDVLLQEVQRTTLHSECAVLYGKKGEHEQALKLLVNQLHDYRGAEAYCTESTEGAGRQARQGVFLMLLKIYLVRGSGLSQEAIEMLNSSTADLDPSQVLQLVPREWAIGVLEPFLRRSIRQHMHLQRTRSIEHGLAKQEHLQARAEILRLTGYGVVLTDDTVCAGANCASRHHGTCSRIQGTSAVVINTETRQVAHKRCVKEDFRSPFPLPHEKRPPSLLTYN
jgi:hypothetical protein